jgi:hypothetical protein
LKNIKLKEFDENLMKMQLLRKFPKKRAFKEISYLVMPVVLFLVCLALKFKIDF